MRELVAFVRAVDACCRFLYRWHLGYPLHGPKARHRTDANWAEDASRVLHQTRRAGWWARKRFRVRGAIRTSATYTTLGTLYGLAVWRTGTLCLLAASVLAGLYLALRAGWKRAASRRYRKDVTRPVAVALAAHLEMTPSAVAARLKLHPRPTELKGGQAVGELPIPDIAQTGSAKWQKGVEELLDSRIPADVEFRWHLHDRPMRLEVRRPVQPPARVPMSAWESFADSLAPGEYFLGLGVKEEPGGEIRQIPEVWDSNEEDPHAVFQAGSRKGKTNELLCVAGTCLRRGGRVTCVDPKRKSLLALQGVPGFTHANVPEDPQAMWDVIREFRDDYRAAAQRRAQNRLSPEPNEERLLIIEEALLFKNLCDDHWADIKGSRKGPPEVYRWIKEILAGGAEFGYKVITVGQDLDHWALFGSRVLYGTVLMAGWTPRHWRMFAASAEKYIAPGGPKGRFLLVKDNGSRTQWIQCPIYDARRGPAGIAANEEAWRQFALNGRAGTDVQWRQSWTERAARVIRPALPAGAPPRTALPSLPGGKLPPVVIGLDAGAEATGMARGTFRKKRREHPIPGEFIHQARTPAWALISLQDWAQGLLDDQDEMATADLRERP